jgi:hypothetical protein
MIKAKFKIKDEWEYKEFKTQEELDKFIADNKSSFSEYSVKPQGKNFLVDWWKNITHTKKNWKKVRSSPYASLILAYKARKIIIGLLIPYLIYMTYKLVINYHASGMMLTVGRVVSIGIMGWVCYRIYRTIPAAKKQIEYYKKFPHTINYCPTNTKETVDNILDKIKQNKEKEGNKDVRKKE